MRFFNTAGPVIPEMYYCVPPVERLEADELLLLIRQWKYFVLHAPRQTGKTTALLALRDVLNAGGEFRCVYVNVEGGQTAREDVGAGLRAILSSLARGARETLGDRFVAEVADDGIGIPPDKLDEIFEAFAQADESTTRYYGGTGLGLALCGKFADLLEGSLSVRSSVGEGSVFTLNLPV